jgi:hypothetical protein
MPTSLKTDAFPLADWKYEVANNDTRLGYVEWCRNKAEADYNFPEPGMCVKGHIEPMTLLHVTVNGVDGIPAWVCDECGHAHLKGG